MGLYEKLDELLAKLDTIITHTSNTSSAASNMYTDIHSCKNRSGTDRFNVHELGA